MRAAKNIMIVLAAGEGKRMNRPYPKMLIPLRGKPLLHWTLANMERCAAVDQVIVTVPKKWRGLFEKKIPLRNYSKVSAWVNGGKERTDSTRNAMAALPDSCEVVGIHDAARPFVAGEHVKQCFEAAKRKGAAILAVPATDTIKVAAKNGSSSQVTIERTVPRAQCWSAQTPQVFKRNIAETLHRKVRSGSFTDDASIAESLGYRVSIVPGSHENIKVTTPKDLIAAESFVKSLKMTVRSNAVRAKGKRS